MTIHLANVKRSDEESGTVTYCVAIALKESLGGRIIRSSRNRVKIEKVSNLP